MLVKGQRTQGIELGISGRITPAWSATGGYAYQDAKITSAQPENGEVGSILAQLPKQTFSLWNRYDFAPQWGVGLGVISRSNMFTSTDNTVNLPGYTRFDGALYAKLSKALRFQLNVENLLNKNYFLSANNNTNITPGSPISVRASITGNF